MVVKFKTSGTVLFAGSGSVAMHEDCCCGIDIGCCIGGLPESWQVDLTGVGITTRDCNNCGDINDTFILPYFATIGGVIFWEFSDEDFLTGCTSCTGAAGPAFLVYVSAECVTGSVVFKFGFRTCLHISPACRSTIDWRRSFSVADCADIYDGSGNLLLDLWLAEYGDANSCCEVTSVPDPITITPL